MKKLFRFFKTMSYMRKEIEELENTIDEMDEQILSYSEVSVKYTKLLENTVDIFLKEKDKDLIIKKSREIINELKKQIKEETK